MADFGRGFQFRDQRVGLAAVVGATALARLDLGFQVPEVRPTLAIPITRIGCPVAETVNESASCSCNHLAAIGAVVLSPSARLAQRPVGMPIAQVDGA